MYRAGLCLAALLWAIFGGEAWAQAGKHRRAAQAEAPRPLTRGPSAYLFRGIFNVYSLGLDDLANKLRARGIRAAVYSHTEWSGVGASILSEIRAGGGGAIVLVGHSLGGGAVLLLANQLGQAGVPVDLVVPIDPVGAGAVPANVRRVINYYQAGNGYGQPVGAASGFQGTLLNADVMSNRRDLWHAGLTHWNIEKSPKVHAEIIREVLKLGRARR
jgi:pimeloyl-ACP methyl ester carboxylesterase